MRSSIACVRCRRSKVKCVNNGVNTPCRACESSRRECTYPVPATGGRRREDSLGGQYSRPEDIGDGEPRRQRPRKSTGQTSASGSLPEQPSTTDSSNPLDPNILTPTVWQELFDLFQGHYSTDLPFVHPPTFSKPLRQASGSGFGSIPTADGGSARPPGSDEFLLAFLALTVRLHPKIVEQHASFGRDPVAATDYYATAAFARLALPVVDDAALCDLDRIQTLLMCAWSEWLMCRGIKAWLYLRTAITLVQLVIMDDSARDSDNEVHHHGFAKSDNADPIFSETLKRTYWSCFVLEQYLAIGARRAPIIKTGDMQLPASDRAFHFGDSVQTPVFDKETRLMQYHQRARDIKSNGAVGRHDSSEMGKGRTNNHSQTNRDGPWMSQNVESQSKIKSDTGQEGSTTCRYIPLLAIYSEVVKHIHRQSIKIDQAPWHSINVLQDMLDDFEGDLPRQDRLIPQNTSAHINLRTSSGYILLHVTRLLCQIVVHRELLPLLPIRDSRPTAPYEVSYDSPQNTPDVRDYWSRNVKLCLQAVAAIMDLTRTSQEWRVLVETPVVAFAIYQSALMGVYCIHCPWMDETNILCPSYTSVTDGVLEGIKGAIDLLAQYRKRLPMADGWLRVVYRLHTFYTTARLDLHAQESSYESKVRLDPTVRRLLTRPPSAALETLDKCLQEHAGGNKTISPGSLARHQGFLDTSALSSPSIHSDGDSRTRGLSTASAQRDQWSAVNNHTSANAHNNTSSGHFRSYQAYQHNPSTAPGSPQYPPASNFRPASSDHQGAAQAYGQSHGWTTHNGQTHAQEGPASVAAHSRLVGEMLPPATRMGNAQLDVDGRTDLRGRSTGRILDNAPRVSLSGDDLRAFVEGVGCEAWVKKTAPREPRSGREDARGWLSLIWNFEST